MQTDTVLTGKHIYDLKGITGLSGEQSFELHVGVTSGGQGPNTGKSVSFKDIRFEAAQGR